MHASGMSNQKAASFALFLSHRIDTIQLISVLHTCITTSLSRSLFSHFSDFLPFPRHLLRFPSEKALIILHFLFRAENIPRLPFMSRRSFSSNWDLSSPGSEGLLLEGCFLLQIKIIKGLCEHM